MMTAATLSVWVKMKGVQKANAEAMGFHGTLKEVSGESAEATLKANVEGRGFAEFKAEMTDAKLRAAKPIVQEARLKYDRGIFSDLRREVFLTRKAMAGLGDEDGIGSALKGAVMPFGKLGTAAVALSGPLLSVAGGATAVAGSLVGAAEGAGALGLALGGMSAVGLGGLIAVAAPAVMSLKALTEAQTAYIQAVETYGVQSTQAETAALKLQAAERMSGKEAVNLVGSLDQVKERWSSLTKPGREAFLGALTDAVDRVDKKLPMIGASANRSAEVGRKGFDDFLDAVTGSDFDKFVHTMTNTEEVVVPELAKATGDWGRVLERVATDSAPSLERVSGIFEHWSNEVLGSTDNSHKLSGEVEHLTTDFMDWVHLLDASGSLLHDIFDAGEGSGNELVVDTTNQFKEWGAWIDSHGPQVEAFFTETKEGVEGLASILAHTGQDWFVMAEAMEPVETAALHILDDFAKIHIGGQSMLTYLLAGFGVLKFAVAAVKIKDLVEGLGWLKTLATQNATAAGEEAAAIQAQADAASAAAAANTELAASNEAVATSMQMSMLESGPVADAEKAGQMSMFPMGGGVMKQPVETSVVPVVDTEAEATAAGGLGAAASKIGRNLGKGIAVAAGGYFVAEIGAQIAEKVTDSNFLEGQSVFKSLTHGFNTEHVARTEQDTFQKSEGLQFHKSKAELESLQHAFGVTLGKIRSDAALGLGAVDGALATGLHQADETWMKDTPQWRGHTADAMSAAVREIKLGMKSGVIGTEEGKKRINELLSQIHLVQGSDPFGLAQATTKQFKEANGITAVGVSDWTKKLERMPPAAQRQTLLSTEGMLSAWAQGHPKLEAQVDDLVRYETHKLGHGGEQMVTVTAGAMAGVAEAFAEGAIGAAKGMGNIFENMEGLLAAEGSGAHPHFNIKILSAASAYHNIREKTESGLGRQEGGFLVGGSGSGDRPGFWGDAKGYVLNREATAAYGFARGGAVPLALEPGERYFSPQEVQRIGPANLAAMNSAVPRFHRAEGGSIGPEPAISGPKGYLRDIGQDAIHQVYVGANEYLAAHKPKTAPGSVGYVGGGGSVAAQMWKSLSASGYNKIGAAGVIGNAGQESSLDPSSVGSGGGGLLGFTTGEISLAALQAFAKSQGKPWTDVGLQMQFFVDHESGIRSGVNSQPNAAAAAAYFMENWERPAVATENQAHREEVAHWAFSQGYQRGGTVPTTSAKAKWQHHHEAQALITGGEALEVPTTITPKQTTGQTEAEKAAKEAKSKATPTEAVHWAMNHLGDGNQWLPGQEWCGAFVAADMAAIGLPSQPKGNGNWAANWAGYGTQLGRNHIQAGAILDYGENHVALAISSSEQIQGNDQDGKVGTSGIGSSLGVGPLTAVRWPPYKGVTGPGAGAAPPAETVPASFHGVATKSLSISSSTPKTIHGIQVEEARRRKEKRAYEQAVTAAAGRPKLIQKLQANVTALETRLSQLRKAATKLRQEIARKRFSAHLGRSLGHVTGFEKDIELKQRVYAEREEFAAHVVGLEPTEPILSGSATEAERRASEEAYVGELQGYLHGKVEPAYMSVLAAENDWRNAALGGERAATSFAGNQEASIRDIDGQIERTNAFTAKVAKDIAAWRAANAKSDHPASEMPQWLKGEIAVRDAARAELPTLRFQEAERRKVLGEARAEFYGGRKHPVQPPVAPIAGSGAFEQNLIEVQGTHWPGLHSPMAHLPTARSESGFGGAIWNTQTQMAELGLQAAQAAASISSAGTGEEAAAATGNSEREGLLEELLRQANQEKLARRIEQETLGAGLPYMGAFAGGGVALVGERGPEIAAMPSGTRIHTAAETKSMLSPSVVINHYAAEDRYEVEVDGKKTEARIERKERRAARNARRGFAR